MSCLGWEPQVLRLRHGSACAFGRVQADNVAANLSAHGGEREPHSHPAERSLRQSGFTVAGDGGAAVACGLQAALPLPAASGSRLVRYSQGPGGG